MSIWILVALFVMGIVFLYIEFIIPALGVIGGIGIICLIISVIMSYTKLGHNIGIFFLIALIIGVPGMVMWGLKIFPKTFFGRKLILNNSEKREEGFSSTSNNYISLIGKTGIAISKLRPSGFAIIENKKYSVVTSGEMIDEGSKIKVIKVIGNSIIVEKNIEKD